MRYLWMVLLIALVAPPAQAEPQAKTLISPSTLAGRPLSDFNPTELNQAQLQALIREKEAAGLPTHSLRVAQHSKAAVPLASFFTALLVAPLALAAGRFGGMMGAALSIGLVFIWFVLYSTGAALAKAGMIDPFWGAWAQNFIFAGVGLGWWVLRR
jgi:lipopolysaccharide export system permease protein